MINKYRYVIDIMVMIACCLTGIAWYISGPQREAVTLFAVTYWGMTWSHRD